MKYRLKMPANKHKNKQIDSVVKIRTAKNTTEELEHTARRVEFTEAKYHFQSNV